MASPSAIRWIDAARFRYRWRTGLDRVTILVAEEVALPFLCEFVDGDDLATEIAEIDGAGIADV